jgi:hypothetical protein
MLSIGDGKEIVSVVGPLRIRSELPGITEMRYAAALIIYFFVSHFRSAYYAYLMSLNLTKECGGDSCNKAVVGKQSHL